MEQSTNQKLQRYARQMQLPQVGQAGQEKLLRSKGAVIGCGGRGCTITQILARAGIGEITICDHDTVDLENLHRQILYEEKDIGKLKAVAAGAKLLMFNSNTKLHVFTSKVDGTNVSELITNTDLVVDATDNLASRYMLNSAAVRLGRDWIYGGCVETQGTVMVVRTRTGACLECLFGPFDPEEQGKSGRFPILPTTAVTVGAIQAHEVIRYLLTKGEDNSCGSKIICIDLWQTRVRSNEAAGKNPNCGTCGNI